MVTIDFFEYDSWRGNVEFKINTGDCVQLQHDEESSHCEAHIYTSWHPTGSSKYMYAISKSLVLWNRLVGSWSAVVWRFPSRLLSSTVADGLFWVVDFEFSAK